MTKNYASKFKNMIQNIYYFYEKKIDYRISLGRLLREVLGDSVVWGKKKMLSGGRN